MAVVVSRAAVDLLSSGTLYPIAVLIGQRLAVSTGVDLFTGLATGLLREEIVGISLHSPVDERPTHLHSAVVEPPLQVVLALSGRQGQVAGTPG